MAKVTIVSDELSQEKVEELQKKVDDLENKFQPSAHAILHYLGFHENLTASLVYSKENIIMKCRHVSY